MNRYLVLKEFIDIDGSKRSAGEIVNMSAERGAKLTSMNLVTLHDEYIKNLVDLRWINETLEVYNRLTGAVLLRIPPGGLTSLSLDIIGNVAGDLTGQVFGQVSTYAADGQIALTDLHAKLDGALATCNMTLADGTEGQVITIKAIDVTSACTLVPANLADGTTITFTTQYAAVTLLFDGVDWNVISVYGTVGVA